MESLYSKEYPYHYRFKNIEEPIMNQTAVITEHVQQAIPVIAKKPKKNHLKLASTLFFPGFITMMTGLFQSTNLGIWSGILIFIGSFTVLTVFALVKNTPRSETRRIDARACIMAFIFMPTVIAFFCFPTITISAIGQVIEMLR